MKTFALVGYPLSHTLSPELHRLIYQACDLSHVYIPWKVAPAELESAVRMFRGNLAGFNVTAPHKKTILGFLDELDFSAQLYGAVNTVKNDAGRLVGYNTDGAGFLCGLDRLGYSIFGRKVLVIGAGGAAQAVALELAHQDCKLTIVNRDVQRAYALQLLLEKRFPGVWVEVASLERTPRDRYDCVINCTPAALPLGARYLKGAELVYDLNYSPPRSKLLELAASWGCQTQNGLPMLVNQGLRAQEIWLERQLDPELEGWLNTKISEVAQ